MSKAVSRGQALQISARVATQVNWDELDGDRLQIDFIVLPPEEFGRRFTAFLKNGGQIAGEPTCTFKRDMRKEGWELLENAPRRITSVAGLELVPFLKKDENSFLKKDENFISGEELVRRARAEFDADCGQEDAEFLIEHRKEIPEKFRQFYLVFTGTVWEDSDGWRDVACLHWSGKRWSLRFRWLGLDYYARARLLRPRK